MIAHTGHDHGMHHVAPHLFAALIACAALLFVLRRVLIAVRLQHQGTCGNCGHPLPNDTGTYCPHCGERRRR